MRKVYAKYNCKRFLFSGIDWAGLVKSDLSVDGLSHFTLTPTNTGRIHTHILIHSHSHAGLTILSTDPSQEHSRVEHVEGKLLKKKLLRAGKLEPF